MLYAAINSIEVFSYSVEKKNRNYSKSLYDNILSPQHPQKLDYKS